MTSDIYTRYFLDECGLLAQGAAEYLESLSQYRSQISQICDEIGAEKRWYCNGDRFGSFIFEGEPDRRLFKKWGSGWYPKKTTNRELWERVEALEMEGPARGELLSIVELDRHPGFLRGDRYYLPCVAAIIPDPLQVFVSVPWFDADPDLVEQYRQSTSEERRDLDSDLRALLWEPPGWLTEIKGWQVERAIDEYNERAKKK